MSDEEKQDRERSHEREVRRSAEVDNFSDWRASSLQSVAWIEKTSAFKTPKLAKKSDFVGR